ncbi:LamG domain-containing protein [Nocardiopsis sp. NPDC058631]|uniref:LamG domain-containing protein n=1 Tax=Nocardiopsis sp. NPDC058631 TaxID=3346566 RepID=UPI0036477A38
MRRSLTRTTAAAAALALVLSLLGQASALADDNPPPDRPDTSTLTARGEACSTDPDHPTLLNSTTLTLRALITHPDAETVSTQVKAQFEWGLEAADEPLGSAESSYTWVSPGSPPAPRTATARDLPEEALIGYRARGHDTRAWGEWSDRCWIEISTSKPAAPPTVTSDDYPDDDRFHGAPGRAGDFTFSSNGVDDAVAYHYSVDDNTCTTPVELEEPGGEATVRITPQRSGPRSIHARSADAYGNSSPCVRVYDFLVAPHADPVAHFPLDEGEDSTAHDTVVRERTAEGTGAIDWARGRVGERTGADYRLESAAVVTSGGHLRTEEPVVDTSGAFTVSAWVRLDGTGSDAVAVSQDGEHTSGFQLGYNAAEEAWVFQRAAHDGPDAGFGHRASSTDPAQTGVWTSLTGSHDSSTGELSLYVDGVLQETVEQTSAGTTEGAFVIGGGQVGGGFVGAWPGAVDDVLVWNRAPVTADEEGSGGRRSEIWEAANHPVVPEGTWWLGETEGGTAEDTSDHGLDAVLHGDPATVWDGAFNDGLFEPGVLLDGTGGEHLRTDGPAVRTDRSFTASAWVRLDDGGADAVALSQSGVGTSGFALGYDAGLRRWVFETPVQDDTGSVEVHRVTSTTSAPIGEWVYLAGVYDHTDGTLTLHVDGIRVAEAEHVGAWHADGDVVIGGAGHAEGVERPWTGGVGLAQLHQGAALQHQIASIEFGILPV